MTIKFMQANNSNHTSTLLKILAYLSLIYCAAIGFIGMITWDFALSIVISAAIIFFGFLLFAILYAFGENIKLISEIKDILNKKG